MSSVTLSAHPSDLAAVRARTSIVPHVAVILGSGLGPLVEHVELDAEILYKDLPGYPAPETAVAGHAGRLVVGTLGDQPAVVYVGRSHCYQGLSALDVTWPVRLAAGLGAHTLIVTNAAGGIDASLTAGAVTLISDHLNLTGASPLTGWPGPLEGTPFVPMGGAYDPDLRALAHREAESIGVRVSDAVYAGLPGPAYETPAEVEYLRRIGAQTVGMSTVHEVIMARALGMRVLGLSLVTNVAGGAELSHEEVLDAGRDAAESMTRLVAGILSRL